MQDTRSLVEVCLISFDRVVCKCGHGSGYGQERVRASW